MNTVPRIVLSSFITLGCSLNLCSSALMLPSVMGDMMWCSNDAVDEISAARSSPTVTVVLMTWMTFPN